MSQFTVSAWAADSQNSASYSGDNVGDGLFSGSANERWESASTAYPHWVRGDFGTAQIAEWYRVTPGRVGTDPTAWTFEGSNDIATPVWDVLDTQSAQSFATGQTKTYPIGNTTAYRYYRMNISAGAHASRASISELQVGDGDPPGTLYEHVMTGVTLGGFSQTTGVVFVVNAPIEVTHLSAYVGTTTGTWNLRIRDSSGAVVASASYAFVSTENPGWREVAITPVTLAAGTYMAEQWGGGVRRSSRTGSHAASVSYGPGNEVTIPQQGTVSFRGNSNTSRYVNSADAEPTLNLGAEAIHGFRFVPAVTTDIGTGAGTLPAVTGSGTGVVTTTAAGAGTLPAITGDGTGTAMVVGTGAATLAPVVGDGTGVVGANVGNGSGTLAPVTGNGAGTATVVGTGAGTLPAVTGDGTGELPADGVTGNGSGTLPLVTGDGYGYSDTEASVAATTDVIVETLAWAELTPAAELEGIAPILRESYVMPPLSAEHPAFFAHEDYPVITEVVGRVHLWVNGVDITYFRGHPTIVRRWDAEAPFGDKTARFELPQLDPWDKPGEGDLTFLAPDASVFIGIVDDEGNVRRAWGPGFLDSEDNNFDTAVGNTWEVKGDLWAALHQVHEPVASMPPTDIGVFIPRLINNLRGRDFPAVPEVITGRTTRRKGARDQYVWQVIQDVLSVDGWTDDGRQWTLTQDETGAYSMTLKRAMTDVTATCAYGTPLVEMDVRIDQSTRVDVVWARGVAKGGAGWANVKYPALELINPPAYPNTDAGEFMNLGTTDADTDSGDGVTVWQTKARELRFTKLAVTGVMTSAWVDVVRRLQRALNISVDGSIGPQTWNATWDRSDPVDLTPLRLPMAHKPHAWPTRHSATGRVLGPNTLFPDHFKPREIPLDFGQPVSKTEGYALAQTYLDIHGDPSATGSVTFIGDANGIDRTRLNIGDNLRIPGFHGETPGPVFQFSRKTVEMDGDSDGRFYVVTFQIDERARDALTVDQLLQRNREALPDPARRPGNPNRSTRNVRDEGYTWDDESPCGVVRRTAVNGATGLWSCITVPFAEVGQLSAIVLESTQPFAFAIFASLRITENKLASIVGDPFASTDPWRDHMPVLEDEYGLIGCWGAQDDACGFSPKLESDPGAVFTGLFDHRTTLEYVTETPPYVTFAFFMRDAAGFVSGEARPALATT